ncbi:unnamed protein product [Mytilus coruscus]|uniref:Uncharacterized protein n=1 Tax=Mytilus coruscus TaxID=42192 RepID=A0A6J8ABP4_MYTCO|nr:unnamed protein product [Mytilus coruscus]
MVKEHINLSHNNKHLIQFSKKGRQHDTKDLVDNLVSLINLMNENGKHKETEDLINTIRNQPSGILGKYVSHTWSDQTWRGKVHSFNGREFEISYWDSILSENKGEVYCLELSEILEDIDDGTFSFDGKVTCNHFCEPGNYNPTISLSKHTFRTKGSKHRIYNKGDKLQPCFTDLVIFTGFEIKLLTIIDDFKS